MHSSGCSVTATSAAGFKFCGWRRLAMASLPRIVLCAKNSLAYNNLIERFYKCLLFALGGQARAISEHTAYEQAIAAANPRSKTGDWE